MQKMKKIALMALKRAKSYPAKSYFKKWQISQETKWRRTSSAFRVRFPRRRRKKRSKKQSKKRRRRRSRVRLRLHCLLITRVLRMRKKTKKPRGSILYQIKINLNRTSRLRLHLMQTLGLRNIFERKTFTTQSVKYIPYQITWSNPYH